MRLIPVIMLLLHVACGQTRVEAETSLPSGLIDTPRYVVLTNNADSGELALDTGVTYTAEPAFDNPADAGNRRLIDSNKPEHNWNAVAGINAAAQAVIFDLKQPYLVEELRLQFSRPQRPAQIDVSLSQSQQGPWRQGGTLRAADNPGEYWRIRLGSESGSKLEEGRSGSKGETARFVRLDFRIQSWGWYIDEVKIYGRSLDAVAAARTRGGTLVLVERKRAHATIVLANRTYPNTLRAAALFQALAQRMTGVRISIVPESRFSGRGTAILIGDSALARRHGVTVEQTAHGDDRYVLRGGGSRNFLALIGNDAPYGADAVNQSFRGSLYAVYDFFERQGCGWFGPEELWQIIPRVNQLAARTLDVTEIPAFAWRRIWMHGLPGDAPLREAWRQGGLAIATGHNYDELVPPSRYKADHPEWFGAHQPDLTHPDVISIAVETLSRKMDERKDDAIVSLPVSANDNEGFIERPYNPAVGNIAAQQLYFANEIAKGLRRKQKGRRFILGILGYWHSHDGPSPMMKAEPEVVVMIVNEGNHAKPLEFPESQAIASGTGRNNTRELQAFARWKETGGLKAVYEWWIPVIGNEIWKEAPWYDGDTTTANLRFWSREGIRYLDYESQMEVNGGFPLRWAQYYIGARASWNPGIDSRRELLAACRKLFGSAAPFMVDFYRLQEKAMRDSTQHVGNWSLPLPHLLYTPEIEQRGEVLLQKALAGTSGAEEKARIRIEQVQWRRLREINAKARHEKRQVYKVVLDGVAMNWNDQKIDAATVRSLFELASGTPIEVLEADGQNRTALAAESYDLASGVKFRRKRR